MNSGMKINPGETTHLFKWLPRNEQMRARRMGKGIWRVIFSSLLNFQRCLILARLSSPPLFSLFLSVTLCVLRRCRYDITTLNHSLSVSGLVHCPPPPTLAPGIISRWVHTAPSMVVLFLSPQQLLKCHLSDVRHPFLFFSHPFFFFLMPLYHNLN